MTDPLWPQTDRESIEASRAQWGWLSEAARSLWFATPRWSRVRVAPVQLLALFFFSIVLMLGFQYVMFEGRPVFHWQAIGGGWLAVLAALWGSWVVTRGGDSAAGRHVPGAAALFGTWAAQDVLLQVLQTVALLAIWWLPLPVSASTRDSLMLGMSIGFSVWAAAACAWLLGRQVRSRFAGWAVLAVVGLGPVLQLWVPTPYFWAPDPAVQQEPGGTAQPEPLILTQEVAEAQSAAVVGSLNAVLPQRRGLVDLYTITFAPYADEAVFSREAGLVDQLMVKRFDAQGRTLRLQNNARTATSLPWATPLNLHRAIERMGQRMDRDEDILFLHLTSHGARDGRLAAEFGPLTVGEVTPQDLKAWLDKAGVRFRVISISACYSGSWITPLSGPGTLVMTAADADHTSYGCGRESELTFFGRAMYDEQLRQTHSFETAHAIARAVIERREKEAGKTDGYSNPQIYVGQAIRSQLVKLEARLAQATAPKAAR